MHKSSTLCSAQNDYMYQSTDWPVASFAVIVQWYVFGAISAASIVDNTEQGQSHALWCKALKAAIASNNWTQTQPENDVVRRRHYYALHPGQLLDNT